MSAPFSRRGLLGALLAVAVAPLVKRPDTGTIIVDGKELPDPEFEYVHLPGPQNVGMPSNWGDFPSVKEHTVVRRRRRR